MPLFKATATIFTLHDGSIVKRSIERFQKRELSAAMRQFLRACIKRIPIRTGFVRQAFRPMRNMFDGKQSGADLNPALMTLFGEAGGKLSRERFEKAQRTNSKGRDVGDKGAEAMKRQFQNEQLERNRRWRRTKAGRAAGRDHRHKEWYYYMKGRRVEKTPENARKLVSPKEPGEVMVVKGLTSTIQFDIQISYYRINDFFRRITNSPWRSLDAGFQAALNYLERAYQRYPYLTEVLVAQQVFLRGSRVGKSAAGDNMAASYRGRLQQWYDNQGDVIPESSIPQMPGIDGPGPVDNFGLGWMGNS